MRTVCSDRNLPRFRNRRRSREGLLRHRIKQLEKQVGELKKDVDLKDSQTKTAVYWNDQDAAKRAIEITITDADENDEKQRDVTSGRPQHLTATRRPLPRIQSFLPHSLLACHCVVRPLSTTRAMPNRRSDVFEKRSTVCFSKG